MALIYQMLDDHAVVTEYVPEEGCDRVKIPAEYEKLPVTEIGPGAFCHQEGLKTVIIPATLEKIGTQAFFACKDLTCVGVVADEVSSVFPPALRYVGKEAFCCTALQIVTFAAPRIELDRSCFLSSRVTQAIFGATRITFGAAVFQESDIQIVAMNNAEVDRISDYCFAFCKHLKAVSAQKIHILGKDCFRECGQLANLAVKLPFDRVEDGALFGCNQLETRGFFRTMYDAISALGVQYTVDRAFEMRYPPSTWLSARWYDAQEFKAKNAAARVLEKIKNTPRLQKADYLLLSMVGTEYDDYDEWDYVNRFFLYEKDEICIRFRNITDWNLIGDSSRYGAPPYRYIGDLSREETDRALKFQNGPQPCQMDWDDLELLLNAELGGDMAIYHNRAVYDFLSGLIDHEEGNTPRQYLEIPHKNPDMLTEEELLHYHIWDVLYNRIAIYRELQHAYNRLTGENDPAE